MIRAVKWSLVAWMICATAGCGRAPVPCSEIHSTETVQATPQKMQTVAEKVQIAPKPVQTVPSWPGFLGPLGTSVSAEKGIVAPWPKEGLPIVWQQAIGNGYACPSVSDGKLYQFDRHGDQARLSCLESRTGKFLWKFEYPTQFVDGYGYDNGPRCCPVIDGDRVYTFGAEGMLHCVNATDGKPLWRVDTAKQFNVRTNFFGVGSTPVIEGDLLIAQVGGTSSDEDTPVPELKGNGSGVVAFDKHTGKVRWQASDELASYSSPTLATVGDRRWCFVLARGGLLGLDPATGKVDFHFPWRAKILESVNASKPVVVGDRVLVSETYGPGSALVAVKPGDAEAVWTDANKGRDDKALQCHWNTPIHHEGYVYGCSKRHTNEAELRCVELATGKLMWKEKAPGQCSLLMVDGHFVCLCEYGELLLLKVNPKHYEEVCRLESDPKDPRALLKHPCWAAPVLADGLLYLKGKGRLVCLELIPRQ